MTTTMVRSAGDLKNNYADVVRQLKEHKHIIITNNGVGESVLINFDDYAQFEEYVQYRYINNELEKAEQEANDPNTIWYTHDEVWNEILERRKKNV